MTKIKTSQISAASPCSPQCPWYTFILDDVMEIWNKAVQCIPQQMFFHPICLLIVSTVYLKKASVLSPGRTHWLHSYKGPKVSGKEILSSIWMCLKQWAHFSSNHKEKELRVALIYFSLILSIIGHRTVTMLLFYLLSLLNSTMGVLMPECQQWCHTEK